MRRLERKLANAQRRLHATFKDGGVAPHDHASLQDVMRVLWDWSSTPAHLVPPGEPHGLHGTDGCDGGRLLRAAGAPCVVSGRC